MAGIDVETSRILDGVRNSKIRLDISSKLKQRSDSLLLGSIHALTEQRHCRTFDVHHVERDFARFTVDGINRRVNHQKESNKCVDFLNKFDEGEGWFQGCYGTEDPFHEFYKGDGESVSLITRFKRNLPVFDGFWYIEDLLTWADAIDDFFEEVNPPEHLKCKIVLYKMKGAAYYWWKQLQRDRIIGGKEEIISWPRMRKLLVSRFTPSNCSTKVHPESNSSKHNGTDDLRISGASKEVCEGDGHSKEMSEVKPIKCVMEFPMLSSKEATTDEDHVEETMDTTVVTHLKFNHDCSDTSVHFDADNEQPKQRTLLAGSSVLNFEFDQPLMEESQMESFENCKTPTIKNSFAMLIESTARIEPSRKACAATGQNGLAVSFNSLPSQLAIASVRPLVTDNDICDLDFWRLSDTGMGSFMTFDGLCHESEFRNDGYQTLNFDPGGDLGINQGWEYTAAQMGIRYTNSVKSVAAKIWGGENGSRAVWLTGGTSSIIDLFHLKGKNDMEIQALGVVNELREKTVDKPFILPLETFSKDGAPCKQSKGDRSDDNGVQAGHEATKANKILNIGSEACGVLMSIKERLDLGFQKGGLETMIPKPLVNGVVKRCISQAVRIGNESRNVAKDGNAKEEQSRRRLLYESNFMNGDTHSMSFDPGGKWRNRTETDGGHGGNQSNVLTGVASCFGKIGINEVIQYKVSQTIVRFVEVCTLKLLSILQDIMTDLHAFECAVAFILILSSTTIGIEATLDILNNSGRMIELNVKHVVGWIYDLVMALKVSSYGFIRYGRVEYSWLADEINSSKPKYNGLITCYKQMDGSIGKTNHHGNTDSSFDKKKNVNTDSSFPLPKESHFVVIHPHYSKVHIAKWLICRVTEDSELGATRMDMLTAPELCKIMGLEYYICNKLMSAHLEGGVYMIEGSNGADHMQDWSYEDENSWNLKKETLNMDWSHERMLCCSTSKGSPTALFSLSLAARRLDFSTTCLLVSVGTLIGFGGIDFEKEIEASRLPCITGTRLHLTRGRVIPLEGWDDENNRNMEWNFKMVKICVIIDSSCVKVLSNSEQTRESLKLFHTVVNGLDPPKNFDCACATSTWILKSSLEDELFEEVDGDDVAN